MKIKIYIILLLITTLQAVQAQTGARFEHRDSLIITSALAVEADWVDLDSDGQFDFFTTVKDSLGRVVPLLIRTDSFKLSIDTLIISGFKHGEFRIADFDNNNRQDIIGFDTLASQKNLSVFYQTDSLEFEKLALDTANILGFEVLDLNRDGRRDIVYFGEDADGETFLKMRLNRSRRRWEAPQDLDIEYGDISFVYALDYDNNGYQDLLVNSATDTTFSIPQIWLNRDSVFTVAADTLPALSNLSVSKGDFNKNGKFDLTLSGVDSLGNFRSILYLNESGGEALPFLNGRNVSSTFMADFTSDGNLDIASVIAEKDSANLLLVNNMSSFVQEPIDQRYSDPGFQRYADVDCDGDLDVMTVLVGDSIIFHLSENETLAENLGPSIVLNHRAFSLEGEVVLMWDSSDDDFTNANSLTYDVYLGSSTLSGDILSPDFVIGPSRRSLVSFGNSGFNTEMKIKLPSAEVYDYGIQSIDNSFYTIGCKGSGGGGTPCELGAVACGSFVLCEELTYENIRTCPDNQLTFTSGDPQAIWYSQVQGFLGEGVQIRYTAMSTDTIYMTIPSSLDCSENRAWAIEVEELDIDDVIGCLGDMAVLEASDRFDSVTWRFGNSMDIINSKIIEFELSADDSVFVTAYLDDCVIKDSIAVTISQPEVTLAAEELQILAGENVQLSANGGVSYAWSPAESLTNASIANPVASPIETTTYQVEVADSLGCIAVKSVLVKVEQQAFIPNLFTPNNDGKNDVLLIYGVEAVRSFSFKIFSRGGNMVFSSDDIELMSTSGWDGTINGKEQASGVYYWEVQGEFPDGKALTLNGRNKGAVYLVK